MKTNSSQRPPKPDVTALLRSIAKELVTRTLAVAELESKIKSLQAGSREQQSELPALIAALANHRRELRYVDKELEQLGWKRDKRRPMKFVHSDPKGQPDGEWQLQGTGFYNSLDVPKNE